MTMLRRYWLLPLLLLCLACPAWADLQADFTAAIAAAKLGKSKPGIKVVDLSTNQTLVAINATDAMMPASNMKLVTTAAALGVLGPDFSFRTELQLLDNDPARGATLLLKGDGDPALGDAKLLTANGIDIEGLLATLVKAVADAGVKRVGTLIIDDTIFDDQRVHPTWPAGQLDAWYCAQVSGLNFNDNCLDVWAQPAGDGQPPLINIVPRAPFISITNKARSGVKEHLIVARQRGTNDLTISGGLRAKTTEPVNITIDDPAIFTARVLAQRLGERGIRVDQIRRKTRQENLPAGRVLQAVRTTMPAVLFRCNKDSQNLFAECLLKRMGHKATGQPGSWDNGAAAAGAWLKKTLGDTASQITIADGSGMSRDNRVSAEALVAILGVMMKDADRGHIFLRSLSVAGSDGTLDGRLDEDLKGRVMGKTGYINGVSTFSGYLMLPRESDEDGPKFGRQRRFIAFSFLFNNVNVSVLDVKKLQDKLVTILDERLGQAKSR